MPFIHSIRMFNINEDFNIIAKSATEIVAIFLSINDANHIECKKKKKTIRQNKIAALCFINSKQNSTQNLIFAI